MPQPPRNPKPKPDNPEQSKRFIDMAREVGVDESPDALDRAFDAVIPPKTNIATRPASPPGRR